MKTFWIIDSRFKNSPCPYNAKNPFDAIRLHLKVYRSGNGTEFNVFDTKPVTTFFNKAKPIIKYRLVYTENKYGEIVYDLVEF